MENIKISRKEFTTVSKLSADLLEAEMVANTLKKYQKTVKNSMDILPESINDISEDIVELQKGINELRAARDKELIDLEGVISSITDIQAQTYMRLHYVRGLSWDEVAIITEAKSAGVVMEHVQKSLNVAKLKESGIKPAFSRKILSEFASLSSELSKKERAADSFRHYLKNNPESMDLSQDDILELEADIEALRLRREERLVEVEEFISSVGDPLVQTYMRLHYIRGMTWKEVSELTQATSDNAVRTRVLRYISLRSRVAR